MIRGYVHDQLLSVIDLAGPLPDSPDEKLLRLWRCVLAQAAIDAQSQVNNQRLQHEGRHARAWLTHPSNDLAFVCRMAGYDPEYALEHFQRYFNQPTE